MDQERFRELVPLYVIGALDSGEKEEFECYVRQNPGLCEKELAEFQAVADHIALTLEPIEPPSEIFTRIKAALERQNQRR